MRKIFILLGVLIALSLSGCGDKGTKMRDSTDITEEKSDLPDVEKKEEAVSDELVDDRNVDFTDYSSYLKKIWIIEWWEFGGETSPVSLVITKIEDGNIEGYFEIDGYMLNSYIFHSRTKDKLPVFYGTIHDGTAECEYDYKDGREGTLVIAFCENNRIEVRLDENEEQCYLLKPYNVSDVKFCNAPTSYEVELDSWGMITLFYANDDDDRSMPQIFLLNEEGDILYEFSTSYLTNSEVLEIIVEDMNEDGLKDVEVVTYLPYAPDAYRAEWYFYQLEDGLFYKDWNNIIVLEDGEVEVSIHGNELFHLLFYGCFPIKPNICQVRENLLEVSISAGSPACYTFYIDKEDARVSDTYFNPHLVGEEYVAYMEDNEELILCNIFNSDQQEDLLYMTILRDFTKTANPMSAIIAIELIDNENIELTYLTGNDYTEVTEIIPIDKDTKPKQNNPYF